MDPNAALAEIRAEVEEVRRLATDTEYTGAQALADKVEALDEWLSKGGFYPEAWTTRVGKATVEPGMWRHADGSPCPSYPDSLNFTYAPDAEPLPCSHGVVVCLRREVEG